MRDDSVMAFEYRLSRSDETPGAALMRELNDLLDSQYPGRVDKPGSVTTPDEMAAPDGAFLVGYDGERPIAIGGLRRLEAGICEIKRMYVVPEARTRGAGRALLAALEAAARDLGYERARLDAGPAQVHSRALFEQAGYVEIPRYNANHIAVYFGEKRLSLLSGGEKSMTAIAFLFAVFLAKPCPFYILDEVEAALDDPNISRFLTLLRRYCDRAQFIVVTHQKRTMEAADTLYGVSMGDDGVSKVISRRLPRDEDAASARAPAAGAA